MTNINQTQALRTIQLLPKYKIVSGIILYIVIGELLKDAIIFPVVEPYLQTIFSPFVTERLAELTEYILLSTLLISVTFFFIVEPVNNFCNAMTRKNHEVQRKNTQLEGEKNLLDIMFRNHAAVMLIVDPANDGRILDANNSALAFYGYSYEEITNLQITDINISCIGHVRGAMTEAYEGAQNVFVFSHKLKSGVFRDVEVHSSKISIQGEEILFSIVHDITDKLHYQKKLEESEEKFRIIFENSGDANYISTLDGHILEANTAFLRLFGYTAEDLNGLKTQDLYRDENDRQRFTQEVAQQGFTKNFEEKLQRKNAEPLDCQVTATLRRSPDGRAIGYHGSINDITDHKLRQIEREALIRELRDALAKVKTLSGFLPICSHCKKIRDDKGYWTQLENYIRDHSDAEFSHSVCQECAEKYYPDIDLFAD